MERCSQHRRHRNDCAVVANTAATVSDSISDSAAAAADDTAIDGTVTTTGTVKKQNFHTGLDPVSRTKNSAQPSEFNTVVTDTVTAVSDEIIAANGKKVSSSFPQDAGIQTHGQQNKSKRGR